jgi:hypothetical protein
MSSQVFIILLFHVIYIETCFPHFKWILLLPLETYPYYPDLLQLDYTSFNLILVIIINSCYQPLFLSFTCHISSESCIVILAVSSLGQRLGGASLFRSWMKHLVTHVANPFNH